MRKLLVVARHNQAEALRVDETWSVSSKVPVVTRDQVRHAKPDPDLFVTAAHLRVPFCEVAVEAFDADLVFLQEVRLYHRRHAAHFDETLLGWPDEGQAEFLAPDGYEVAYRTNAVTRHGEHGNALLSRWPIGDVGHHDVSDHRFEQRGHRPLRDHRAGERGVWRRYRLTPLPTAAFVGSILLGVGDGTFLPKVDYPTQLGPVYIAVGDFDGNFTLDIVTSDFYDGIGSILPGVGDGTFLAGTPIPPFAFAVATAAVRDAKNGNTFVARARDALGAPIRILTGEEEARLASEGVLAALRDLTSPRALVIREDAMFCSVPHDPAGKGGFFRSVSCSTTKPGGTGRPATSHRVG